MFMGKATPVAPVTFPQGHIIHAGSIHQAHEIKKGGYFVVGSEEVQLFKASATPDFSFKIATVKLTPAFSKLASKSNGGCKRKPKGQKEEGNVGQVIKKRSTWRK